MGVRINRSSGTATPLEPIAGGDVRLVASVPLPLGVRYQPLTGARLDDVSGASVLAAIHFGAMPAIETGPHPVAHVAMAQLGGDAALAEVWTSELPVRYGEAQGIRYATNDEVLFGVITEAVPPGGADFEEWVRRCYESVFALCESQGYPHLLRMWNYFASINQEREQLENYQRFCRARALAFRQWFGEFVPRLPSASAIGSEDGPFVLYFIAARVPGTHRENPRQISAYTYPRQYGPQSPSFARATLKRFNGHELFFISGTASIVGHESMHPGDVGAQLEETLRNIETLIDSTGRDEGAGFRGLGDLGQLKVYLRRPADLPLVRDMVRRRVGEGPQVLYLHGDVCRGELLVEIEAVIGR